MEDGHTHLSSRLETELAQRIAEKQARIHHVLKLPDSLKTNSTHFAPTSLLQYSPLSIAQQMSLHDMNIFCKIERTELLGLAWNTDKLKHRAHNVCSSLARLNDLSFWVPTTILFLKDAKLRAEMIEKVWWLVHSFPCLSHGAPFLFLKYLMLISLSCSGS